MGLLDKKHEKIKAVFVLEILGKPQEYLIKTLKEIITQMSEEKGVKVIEQKIHEPKPARQKEGFFTTFAEIEVDVEESLSLALLMFKYMPAHVEVIHPESITLSNHEMGTFLDGIIRRLHKYDEISRILQIQKEKLEQKLNALSKEPVEKANPKKKPVKKK
jgi:hypothetical protein